VAPDLSLWKMLDNRSFPIVAYCGSPYLFSDGRLVKVAAIRVQYYYNSTQCLREFGPWIYVRIFRVNAKMASAC